MWTCCCSPACHVTGGKQAEPLVLCPGYLQHAHPRNNHRRQWTCGAVHIHDRISSSGVDSSLSMLTCGWRTYLTPTAIQTLTTGSGSGRLPARNTPTRYGTRSMRAQCSRHLPQWTLYLSVSARHMTLLCVCAPCLSSKLMFS